MGALETVCTEHHLCQSQTVPTVLKFKLRNCWIPAPYRPMTHTIQWTLYCTVVMLPLTEII